MEQEINIEEVEIEDDKRGFWNKIKPTSLTAYTFEVVFLTALIIGLTQFPLSEFMSGNLNVNISFGWPFSFFELNVSSPGAFPIKIMGGLLDLLIYLVISYAFDLIVSFIARAYKKNARKIDEKKEAQAKKDAKQD